MCFPFWTEFRWIPVAKYSSKWVPKAYSNNQNGFWRPRVCGVSRKHYPRLLEFAINECLAFFRSFYPVSIKAKIATHVRKLEERLKSLGMWCRVVEALEYFVQMWLITVLNGMIAAQIFANVSLSRISNFVDIAETAQSPRILSRCLSLSQKRCRKWKGSWCLCMNYLTKRLAIKRLEHQSRL